MSPSPNEANYQELRSVVLALGAQVAEQNSRVAELHSQIAELNSKLQAVAPASAGRRRSLHLPQLKWPLALGFVMLTVAVAQTSDPIAIGPDGNVKVGTSLEVARLVKAATFEGDGTKLKVVPSQTAAEALAGKLNTSGGTVSGDLKVGGKIDAGNSDIYFTKTDHDHSLIGNTTGYAAIENSSNYAGLMVLGRTVTNVGRIVRVWDRLGVGGSTGNQVNVPLDVKGEMRGMPWVSGEYSWSQGSKAVQMTKTDHSVCFLTRIVGKFQGYAEYVEVVPSGGYWYLQGGSQQQDVGGRARCIGAPDNSW